MSASAVPSAKSLRTLGCSALGPMDLCTFRSSGGLKHNLLFPWEGLCSPSTCLDVQGVERCGKSNLWKLRQKLLSASAFSMSSVLLPYLVGEWSTISVCFFWWLFCWFLLTNVPIKALLVFVTSLAKSSSNWALLFLIPTLHIWAVSPYSSQDTCSWFHCMHCLFVLHFDQEVLTWPLLSCSSGLT